MTSVRWRAHARSHAHGLSRIAHRFVNAVELEVQLAAEVHGRSGKPWLRAARAVARKQLLRCVAQLSCYGSSAAGIQHRLERACTGDQGLGPHVLELAW
jgi:hypothetical protein